MCWYFLHCRGDSNEYIQHMFLLRTDENYPSIIIKYPRHLFHCITRIFDSLLVTMDPTKEPMFAKLSVWKEQEHSENVCELHVIVAFQLYSKVRENTQAGTQEFFR